MTTVGSQAMGVKGKYCTVRLVVKGVQALPHMWEWLIIDKRAQYLTEQDGNDGSVDVRVRA